MRKIQTQEEKDKRKKKNQIIIGIVMIGLLVLSSIGYSIIQSKEDEEEIEKYGDFEFIRNGEGWMLELDEQVFYFQNLPQEVENISVTGFYSLENYANKPLYFVNSNSAAQEILGNIGRYVLRAQNACLISNCSEGLPIKTCEDNLIVFKEGNETKETRVWKEENCVHISGDYLAGVDAFLYKILGVR